MQNARMIRRVALVLVVMLAVAPTSARAETLFYAYDPADSLTLRLTRGITLEIERGFFGGTDIRRLFSTAGRGSAALERGGPDAALAVLPDGARETALYRIRPEGDGRALGNALCPGSAEAWFVTRRVRGGGGLTLHAVGRWSDGVFRHCAVLNYTFRGHWAAPGATTPGDEGATAAPRQ